MSVNDKEDKEPLDEAWEDDKDPNDDADELIAADIIPPG